MPTPSPLYFMQQIEHYLRGEMAEPEALALWVQLLGRPDQLELLEFTRLLYRYFDQTLPGSR